jgi:adenosine deaminase
MRHDTLLDLAADAGTHLPDALTTPGGLHLDVPHDRRGFWRFQSLYDTARRLVTSRETMRRLVLEAAASDAAEGSGWTELQIDPHGYEHVAGDPVSAVDVILDAAREAERSTGIGIGVILAGSRTRHPLDVATVARIAVRNAGDGVVGFGLSNDEKRRASGDYSKAFRIARDAGLLTTPHAGELLGADHVAHTLDTLRPQRLGHGVRAAEDPATLTRLADEGVVAEVCPASNVALGVYRHEADVPVPALLEAGVRVSLNADDPLLFRTRLAGQYAIARHAWAFDDARLADVARMSVTTSTAPAEVQRRLLDGITAWLSSPARPRSR